jgi:heptosyltransferase-1
MTVGGVLLRGQHSTVEDRRYKPPTPSLPSCTWKRHCLRSGTSSGPCQGGPARNCTRFPFEDALRQWSNLSIEPPASILVLKPSSLGDIVHTLPAVARLQLAWPAARISWLVNPEWAPLLAQNPGVAEIVQFPRQDFRGLAGLRQLYPWARTQVLGRQPDLALDFQGLLRTALIGRLARPREFIGLANAREGAPFFYDHTVPAPEGRPHAVDRYLALADDAIGPPAVPAGTPLAFPLPAGEPVALKDGAVLQPDFILIHPFARGAAKSLTPEQVSLFCDRLHPRQVVVAGRQAIAVSSVPAGVVDLVNQTTLLQLIWLLRRAAFVISVDSGPMHLAAALNRPLVSIHTWSDPACVGPYRPDAWVWKNASLRQFGQFVAEDKPAAALRPLSPPDIDAICAVAISPSCSYA